MYNCPETSHMPNTPRILLSSVLLLISACQGTGSLQPAATIAAQQVHTVTLNREFTIRADRASEYIQDGQIKPYDKISEYYPHCIFGLREISASARTVKPDSFSVQRVHTDQFISGFLEIMVAGGDDFGHIMSTTYFYLHSERQPEVFRLSCQQLDASFEARQPTLDEMQQTLGELFTLGR